MYICIHIGKGVKKKGDVKSNTHAYDRPLLDLGILLRHGLDVGRDQGRDDGGREALEEGAEVLLLLLGVGGKPGELGRLAHEPVRDEDLVLRGARRGEDVGALQRLWVVPENVVYCDEALCRVGGAGDVFEGEEEEEELETVRIHQIY